MSFVLKTIYNIIKLTEAWLGLSYLDNNQFNFPNYTTYQTTNYPNQNDGIIAFIINTLSDAKIINLNMNLMSVIKKLLVKKVT